MVECALIMAFSVPLLFGVSEIGIRLGRSLEAMQLTRDVAHMYALGADFTGSGSQAIAAQLGRSFKITSTGDSVLIFSRIVRVYQADCDAASLPNCANVNKTVFAQRIVLGNRSLRTSAFGTPPSTYINAQGNIDSTDYYRYTPLVANGFTSVMTRQLDRGQAAWVVEGYFPMPELDFLRSGTDSRGYYVRFIF